MSALRRLSYIHRHLEHRGISLYVTQNWADVQCGSCSYHTYQNRHIKSPPTLTKSKLHLDTKPMSLQSLRFFHISSANAGKVVPFLLSDIGEGIREVVVKEWFVAEGDSVNQFDQICEVQSDKASVTITSRYDGVVTKLYHKVDDMALVGSPLVDIELGDGAHDSVAADQVDDVKGTPVAVEVESEFSDLSSSKSDDISRASSKSLATPAVRRIAGENNINLGDVVGTGKNGRVMKEDVLTYISQTLGGKQPAAPQPAKPAAISPSKSPAAAPDRKAPAKQAPVGEDTLVNLKGIKKAMAKSMTEALKIPHFGYNDEIDMSKLVQLRKELKGSALLGDIAFSYMPVILKATSLALTEFPILNSSFIPEEQVLMKASHNIGFAMDSPDGLIVPNIKNVQNLSVLEIAEEMGRLIKLGEVGKLGQDDITGGTFSLSNIGSIGGTYAKPVIMPPQSAIGAIGKIQALPRFDEDDNIIKAHIMKVSWTADHRIIEGAQMARFSNLWKSYLENPALLILNMR